MPTPVEHQWWGQTTLQLAAETPAARSIRVDTDKWTLVVGDGVTPGGRPLMRADGSMPFTGAGLGLTHADNGALQGPTLDLFRDSASPAANDLLGAVEFNGRDSGAAKQEYARLRASVGVATAGAEYGRLEFWAADNGTMRRHARIGDGWPLYLREAPGGQLLVFGNAADTAIGQFSNDGTGLGIISQALGGYIAGFRFLTGEAYLGGPYGAEAFRAERTASAVNRTRAKGGLAGAPAEFGTEGESAVPLWLLPKGGAPVLMGNSAANTRPALQTSNLGYASNYRSLILGSTGTNYATQYTGAVTLSLGQDTASVAGGSFSGDGREIVHRRQVNWTFPNSGGTNWLGSHLFIADLYHSFRTDGGEQVRIQHNANAVNFLAMGGGATGVAAYLFFTGTDTDTHGSYITRGAGQHRFASHSASANLQFVVNPVASPTRHLIVEGSNGGNPVLKSSAGHIELDPAGSNTVVLTGLPTSAAGLPTGGVWNDGGTLKVA